MERRSGTTPTRLAQDESPKSAPSSLSANRISASPSSGGLRRKQPTNALRRGGVCQDGSSTEDIDIESRASRRGNGDASNRVGGMVILRKIVHAIFTDLDDETLQHPDTEPVLIAITLIKEAMIGLIIAFVVVSLVLFIDHQFVLELPTARTFRRATFAIMNDRETLRNLEEQAGLKFLDMEEYETMVEEVAKSANRTSLAETILAQRTSDMEKWTKDLSQQTAEIPQMLARLALDDYCERCLWNREAGLACHRQGQALGKKYQSEEFESAVREVQRKSCRRIEGKLVREGKEVLDDFCSSCLWQMGSKPKRGQGRFKKKQKGKQSISCSARAAYLTYKDSIPLERAQLRIMIEASQCRKSVREEEQKMNSFCHNCMWDDETTCLEKATSMVQEKHYNSKTAILSAMETPSCVREKSATPEGEVPERADGRFRQTSAGGGVPLGDAQSMLDRFCQHCMWDEETSCRKRVSFLMTKEQYSAERAMISTMKNPACTKTAVAKPAEEELENESWQDGMSVEEQESMLGRFCPNCMWDEETKTTCGKRISYLTMEKQIMGKKAMLSTMKRPSCIAKEDDNHSGRGQGMASSQDLRFRKGRKSVREDQVGI